MAASVISVEYKGRIATITISNEKKLNALNQQQYYEISKALREIATHDEVYITVLLAKGRYFSAYACLTCSSLSHSAIRENHQARAPFRRPGSPSPSSLLSSNVILPAHLTLRRFFSFPLDPNDPKGGHNEKKRHREKTIVNEHADIISALRSGADVSISREVPDTESDPRQFWMRSFLAFNLNITQAFYTHPKILVVGLNGPVVGLSAAIVAHADFIYCAPHTFLLTPFSSLGLVAEGGASRALVQRLGPARANEALIMSKRITADELERAGFVNAVFQTAPGEDAKFRDLVLNEVQERLGPHLNGDSLLGIKKLIRKPDRDVQDVQNAREVFDGLERFVAGIPQEEFRKIASGEKRHKL